MKKDCNYCKNGIYSDFAYDFMARGIYMEHCPYCGRKMVFGKKDKNIYGERVYNLC